MAVAAPKRRSSVAPAPVPSRTTAPARRAPARAPQRARPKPQRARTQPKRATGGQPSLALAVGRTAATVRHLPDSGLIVRMTRGRAWIAVLGVLLVGIVALNVVTLSFAASSGKIDEQITTLEEENSMLGNLGAKKFSSDAIHSKGAAQGLAMPTTTEPQVFQFSSEDVTTAAQRLAAAG
jgi:hypothetical protein